MSFLLAATAAAIVLTQHLRDQGPVVSSIHWKTRPGPRYRACFLLTKDDRVQIAVVDFSDREIRVLAAWGYWEAPPPPSAFWRGISSLGQRPRPAPHPRASR